MKFEELPHEVQIIAANVIASRFEPCLKDKNEPALKLARDVRDFFIELYALPEHNSVHGSNITPYLLRLKRVISELELVSDGEESRGRFLAELKLIETDLK